MALAIADAKYLWSEVDRLKTQVQDLQAAGRESYKESQRMKEFVASFVTHAQLEAALCTKISQSNAAVQVDKLRSEVWEALEKKADVEVLHAMQAKKLDISVFESSTWDLRKFRTTLEQTVHDLFASFAHRIEEQVNSKLSIDDFDHIFNPESNGQRAAIENAATKLTRMNDQIEALQEYVKTDKQRQHKLADVNVSLLDLTRKQTMARNGMAQLQESFDRLAEQMHMMDTQEAEARHQLDAMQQQMAHVKERLALDETRWMKEQATMKDQLKRMDQTTRRTGKQLEDLTQHVQQGVLEPLRTECQRLEHGWKEDLDALRGQERKTHAMIRQTLHQVKDQREHLDKQNAAIQEQIQSLRARLTGLQTELDDARGPLLTVASNLREENVSILEEIRRSQHESREIMLDYSELVDREQSTAGRPARPLPYRPSTTSTCSRGGEMAMSARKTKHLHALRNGIARPKTSSGTSTPQQPRTRPSTTSTWSGPSNRISTASRALSPRANEPRRCRTARAHEREERGSERPKTALCHVGGDGEDAMFTLAGPAKSGQ